MPSKAILSIMKVSVKYLRIIKTVICTSILAFLVLLVLFQVSSDFIEGIIKPSKLQTSLFLYAVTICYVCVTLCVINHFQKSMPNSTGAIWKSVLFMTDQSDSKNDNDFQVCPSDCLDSILFMIYIFWKIDTGMHKILFYRGALALFTMVFEDGH